MVSSTVELSMETFDGTDGGKGAFAGGGHANSAEVVAVVVGHVRGGRRKCFRMIWKESWAVVGRLAWVEGLVRRLG